MDWINQAQDREQWLVFVKTVMNENTTTLRPHAQDHTQCRRPTVKEHDHQWDSQQDFNELKNVINFEKSNLTILSTSVTHTRQHACNTSEAFPLKCWSPSDDVHHWPEHVKA
jgi:hypothetical protein